MSPMWGKIVDDFNDGIFKNIQKYSGIYTPQVFTNDDRFNLQEIEILHKDKFNVENNILHVPKSVRKLRLQNLKNNEDSE
jgi:hypothetical protein